MIAEQRLKGVDFWRATGCLAVMAHHLIFRLDRSAAPDWAEPLLGFFINGSFGVAVFFVLSGFLLARPFWLAFDENRPMPSLRVYALRRVARILPGFWLALTVTFVVSFALLGARLDGQLVQRYFAGFALVSEWHWVTLFPVEFNGPLWSIGFEVMSYLLLPLCFLLLFLLPLRGWRASRAIWVGVIIGTLLLHWLIVRYASIDEVGRDWKFGLIGGAKTWLPAFNPIGFFAIFAIGSLAAGIQVAWRSKGSWVFDVLALAGLGAAVVVLMGNMGEATEGYGLLRIPYGFPAFPLAVGLFLAAAPSSRVLGEALDTRPARFIARISFGIYLWHFLIISMMAAFFPLRFGEGAANPWAVWLGSSALVVGLSVLAGALSFYLLERPVVNWARGLEGRSRTPEAPGITAEASAP